MKSLALLAAVCVVACEPNSVNWGDTNYPAISVRDTTAFDLELPGSAVCRANARTVAGGSERHATWWSVRKDSSAVLMFARTQAGKWAAPVVVDTADASRRGCNRPAPAIAVENGSGYIYLVYFLEPVSGAGIFFSHWMDSAGFHDPVSIAYGKRPSAVSIASSGERVAVAYEEPNSARGQVWVALSRSMGHIFEERQAVSSPNEVSGTPAIRLNGTKLDVEWRALVESDSSTRTRTASRTGTWN